jgi:hypothetical protein
MILAQYTVSLKPTSSISLGGSWSRDLAILALPVRRPQRLLVDFAVEQRRQAFDKIASRFLLAAPRRFGLLWMSLMEILRA